MSTLERVQRLSADFAELARLRPVVIQSERIEAGTVGICSLIDGRFGKSMVRWASGKDAEQRRLQLEHTAVRDVLLSDMWWRGFEVTNQSLATATSADLTRLSPSELTELEAVARQLQELAAANPAVPVPAALENAAILQRGFDAIGRLAQSDSRFRKLDDAVHDRNGHARANGKDNTRQRIDRLITPENPLGWEKRPAPYHSYQPVTKSYAELLFRIDQMLVSSAQSEQHGLKGGWLGRFLGLDAPSPDTAPADTPRPVAVGIDPNGEIRQLWEWANAAIEADLTNLIARLATDLTRFGQDLEVRIHTEREHRAGRTQAVLTDAAERSAPIVDVSQALSDGVGGIGR